MDALAPSLHLISCHRRHQRSIHKPLNFVRVVREIAFRTEIQVLRTSKVAMNEAEGIPSLEGNTRDNRRRRSHRHENNELNEPDSSLAPNRLIL